MRTLLPFLLCCLALPVVAAAQEVSFSKDVAPVLIKNCIACHGAKNPKGEYQLDTYEHMMKPGESGLDSIVAKKIGESWLIDLISTDDKDTRMPKDADPLKPEQIAVIKKWVEQGAKYDAEDPRAPLTAIAPKPPHPDPPAAYRRPIPITALDFRPDGQELAVEGYHEITIWNPEDGKLLRRIKNVAERTHGLAYNADGSLLAVAAGTPGQMGEVKLFNPADGSLLKDLVTTSDVVFDVAFSPDGKKLAACSADRTIRIFDVASGKQEALIEDHADWVMAVAWSPDGKSLASASRDKTSKVFDVEKAESRITYPGHGQPVYAVAWKSDGKQVITAGEDRKIHLWNPEDGKKAQEIGGFGQTIFELETRGNVVASACGDKQVRLHDANSRKQIRAFGGHTDWVYCVSYNEPSKRIASGTYNGEVRIFSSDDGKEIAKFFAAPGYAPAEQAQK